MSEYNVQAAESSLRLLENVNRELESWRDLESWEEDSEVSRKIIYFLVDKYKTEEDRTLTRKISKLNMHSINKKSSRIGQKFLNTIGKDPAVRAEKRT